MNHGAIAKNGKRLPFPYYPRLAQVDAIIAIRHVGLRIPCPVLRGAVIVPVERAVIDALGLEEDDRVIVFNGRAQQTFGVIRSEEHTSEVQSIMRHSYAVSCLKQKIYIK